MSDELSTTKERAESTIQAVERCLPKWNAWYPKENTMVEIPRADLLALMHFAKIGLKSSELLHGDEQTFATDPNEC